MAEVSLGSGVSASWAPVPRTGDEILMAFAGPRPQRRVTVLFRILMVIPQYIVLYLLGIAVAVVVVIGWFAALFTGRLPAGLAGFLVGWLRWSTRVMAYAGLLTDQYPPFTLDDEDYPVRVSAAPGRLNRLAVLFRFILAFPVSILVGVLWLGVPLIGLVIWLIVLVTGSMPAQAYEAVAAVIRFNGRFYGYFYLMSGTYPGGLFGDQADADAAPAVPSGAELGQPDSAWPDTALPGYGQPAGPGGAPLTAGSPADPGAWRLVLSSGARTLVGVFIGVGAVLMVGYIILIVTATSQAASNATRVDAIDTISAAHTRLDGELSGLSQRITACKSQAAVLSCVTKVDRKAAQDFGAFAVTVRSTPVPASAATAAGRLAVVSEQIQSAFQRLGAATSAAQYQKINSSSVLPKVAQFNSAYQNLGKALGAA